MKEAQRKKEKEDMLKKDTREQIVIFFKLPFKINLK